MVSRNQQRKAKRRARDRQKVDFPLPSSFPFQPISPKSPPINVLNGPQSDLIAYHTQHSITLSSGHVSYGIPNPDHRPDTPRYAAFRIPQAIRAGERTMLRFRVRQVWEAGLPAHTRKSRGAGFHQWWFGIWCRYASHSVVSADSLPASARKRRLIRLLTASYDLFMGKRPQKALREIDPMVAKSMQTAHRRSARYLRALCDGRARAKAMGGREGQRRKRGKAQSANRRTLKRTRDALALERGNAPYRLGGMGTMLAVSWGEGTEFHRDTRDLGNHYTILTLLGAPALLHLPELGVTIPMQSGDVVGFLAERYLHKLEPLGAGSGLESESESGSAALRDMQLKQIVFTCWTDKVTETRLAELPGFFTAK